MDISAIARSLKTLGLVCLAFLPIEGFGEAWESSAAAKSLRKGVLQAGKPIIESGEGFYTEQETNQAPRPAYVLTQSKPDVPSQHAPIVTTQISQARPADAQTDRTIGICHLIENQPESRLSAKNSLEPVADAWSYFKVQEKRLISEAEFKAARFSLLQAPKHGKLEIDDKGQAGYFPTTPEYFGPDHATVFVEISGYKVKVQYFFKVMQSVAPGSAEYDPYKDKKNCPKGRMWRISPSSNDNNRVPLFVHTREM